MYSFNAECIFIKYSIEYIYSISYMIKNIIYIKYIIIRSNGVQCTLGHFSKSKPDILRYLLYIIAVYGGYWIQRHYYNIAINRTSSGLSI